MSDAACVHEWTQIAPPSSDGWQDERCAWCQVLLDRLPPLGSAED